MNGGRPGAARYSQISHINFKAALDEAKDFDILSIRLTNGSCCQGRSDFLSEPESPPEVRSVTNSG